MPIILSVKRKVKNIKKQKRGISHEKSLGKKPSKKLKAFFDTTEKKQIDLARLLNLNRATIWQWLNRNGVPAKYVTVVSKFTQNKVSKHEIRPDIF